MNISKTKGLLVLIALVAIGSAVYESGRAWRLEASVEAQRVEAHLAAEPAAGVPLEQSPTVPARIAERSQKLDWQEIESPHYLQYMANLRGIGCPEQTIHDIVAAEVNRLYATRAKALRAADPKRYEYWKPMNYGYSSFMDKEMIENMMALAKEKRAVLKELLGTEPPEILDSWPPYLNCWEMKLDFLPAEKQAKVMEIEQQLNARVLQNTRSFNKGDSAERDSAFAEKEEALLKLLSPEEKFEFDLRMSPSAGTVNFYLGDFEPTEQEFREMVRLRLNLDRELGLPKLSPSPEETARRKAAEKELEAQYRYVLGEERYKELKELKKGRR